MQLPKQWAEYKNWAQIYYASRISTLWGFSSPESTQSSLNCLFSSFCFGTVSCSLCFGCGMSKVKKKNLKTQSYPLTYSKLRRNGTLSAAETICALDPCQLSSYFKILKNHRIPDWKGTSRITWSNFCLQNQDLDKMTQQCVQLDLKVSKVAESTLPWGHIPTSNGYH